MQCRASNPLARRIKGWSPKTCLGRPARKTRRTEVMKMKGEGGETPTNKRERPSEDKNARCQESNTNPGLGEKPHARDCRAEATYTISGLGETCKINRETRRSQA